MEKVHIVRYGTYSSWEEATDYPHVVGFSNEQAAREMIGDAAYIFEGQIRIEKMTETLQVFDTFAEWKTFMNERLQMDAKRKLNSFIRELSPFERKQVRAMLPESSLMKEGAND